MPAIRDHLDATVKSQSTAADPTPQRRGRRTKLGAEGCASGAGLLVGEPARPSFPAAVRSLVQCSTLGYDSSATIRCPPATAGDRLRSGPASGRPHAAMIANGRNSASSCMLDLSCLPCCYDFPHGIKAGLSGGLRLPSGRQTVRRAAPATTRRGYLDPGVLGRGTRRRELPGVQQLPA
jgi:hypothetical protein